METDHSVPVLPEEIIFSILIFVSAITLHNKMRYVCKQWYNIIRDPIFVNKHLQQSRTGLLIGKRTYPKSACIMQKVNDGFIYEEIRLPHQTIHHPSCDGLLLFGDIHKDGILHVLNPVTKQQVSLPGIDLRKVGLIFFCGLTKSHVNGDYKVVCSFKESPDQLMILTVGKSKTWRSISTKTFRFHLYSMFSVDGFLHMVNYNEPPYVVTLEVDSETLSQCPVPEELNKGRCVYKGTGRFLSAMIEHPCNELNWDVWRLIDWKKGVWTKLYTIKLQRQKHMPHIRTSQRISLHPSEWIDNGNVLILDCLSKWHGIVIGCIAYNVKTGEATPIFLKKKRCNFNPPNILSAHVNSLVCLKSN